MTTREFEISAEALRRFHDAELVSVSLDRKEDRVDCVFLKDDGTCNRFECSGVRNIKCSPLLFQNVISRLFVAPVTLTALDETRRILAWSFTLDGHLAMKHEQLEVHVADVGAGRLQLLYVDPSWGAEVAILCRSIVLRSA